MSKSTQFPDGFLNKNSKLQVILLSDEATLPTQGSRLATGFDLYSAYEYTVPPLEKTLVKTDLVICVPEGTYGRIAPRSGLAANNHISIGGGVIDRDYRGNLMIVIFNHSNIQEFKIKAGDRIAQLICEKFVSPTIEVVETMNKTERGTQGFGPTGLN